MLWDENNGTFSELKISQAYILQPANAPIPQLTYYLYDHLGNTRVTYSVEVLGTNNISYTTESAMDYFPYDEQTLRSKNDLGNHFSAANRDSGWVGCAALARNDI